MEEFFRTFFAISHPITQVLIAVGLGVFIGLRRQTHNSESKPSDIMGVRTTTLLVLMGTIVTFFDHLPFVFPIIFVSVIIFLLIAYINGVFRLGLYGLTSEISGVLLFLIGVLIGQERAALAIVIAVILGISTAYKSHIHNFADTFSLKEWSGTLQLLVITALVLPFLPRTAIDPFGVFVPFNMWLLVIFISAIGFVGYFCGKYFSARASLLVTALFGSLVSSTATTVMLAGRARTDRQIHALLLVGLMISIAVMHARVILEVIVLQPQAISAIVFVPVSMLVTALAMTLIAARRVPSKSEVDKSLSLPKDARPFEFLPALKFAVFFTVILYTIYFADKFFGALGVYLSALITSFADVDAVIFSSLLTQQAGHITSETALISISIALLVNTLVKLLYIGIFGSRIFLRKALPGVLIITGVGAVASVVAITVIL